MVPMLSLPRAAIPTPSNVLEDYPGSTSAWCCWPSSSSLTRQREEDSAEIRRSKPSKADAVMQAVVQCSAVGDVWSVLTPSVGCRVLWFSA